MKCDKWNVATHQHIHSQRKASFNSLSLFFYEFRFYRHEMRITEKSNSFRRTILSFPNTDTSIHTACTDHNWHVGCDKLTCSEEEKIDWPKNKIFAQKSNGTAKGRQSSWSILLLKIRLVVGKNDYVISEPETNTLYYFITFQWFVCDFYLLLLL